MVLGGKARSMPESTVLAPNPTDTSRAWRTGSVARRTVAWPAAALVGVPMAMPPEVVWAVIAGSADPSPGPERVSAVINPQHSDGR